VSLIYKCLGEPNLRKAGATDWAQVIAPNVWHLRHEKLPIYKGPPHKSAFGKLEILLGIIVLAIIEYQRHHQKDRPSLAKLMLLAEVEVIRAFLAEIRRRHLRKRERQHKRKLSEFEERLEEQSEDRLTKRMAIASALPVVLVLFTVGAILGGKILGAIIG
jgi:hypothetical protein